MSEKFNKIYAQALPFFIMTCYNQMETDLKSIQEVKYGSEIRTLIYAVEDR